MSAGPLSRVPQALPSLSAWTSWIHRAPIEAVGHPCDQSLPSFHARSVRAPARGMSYSVTTTRAASPVGRGCSLNFSGGDDGPRLRGQEPARAPGVQHRSRVRSGRGQPLPAPAFRSLLSPWSAHLKLSPYLHLAPFSPLYAPVGVKASRVPLGACWRLGIISPKERPHAGGRT